MSASSLGLTRYDRVCSYPSYFLNCLVLISIQQQVWALSCHSQKSNSLSFWNDNLLFHRRQAVQTIVTSLISTTIPFPLEISAIAADINTNTPTTTTNDDEYFSSVQQQLYNPDGSLRENVSREAKERTVSIPWNIDDENGRVVMDAGTIPSIMMEKSPIDDSDNKIGSIPIQYNLPEKWNSNTDRLYVDTSEGMNLPAAEHIYVYQAPGTVSSKDLANAGTIGVAKALRVIPPLQRMYQADIIGGRKRHDDTNKRLYYEFDLAAAPKTCDDDSSNNNNNLGLGFCPFDTIYLTSATVAEENGRLYVLCIECSAPEWKRASAELKRIRSSFVVPKFSNDNVM
jgi:hypothetical protein